MKTLEKRIEEKIQTIIDICDAITTEPIEDIEEAKWLLSNDMEDMKNKMKVMAFLFANEEIREMNDNDNLIAPKWYELYSTARHKTVDAEVFLEMFKEKLIKDGE